MTFRSVISKLAAPAGALGAIVLLASCTVAVEEGGPPRPGPGPGPGPMCTREYAPVCAERGRDRETFPNACMARTRGYDVAHPGECRRGGHHDRRPGDRDGHRGDHRGDRDDHRGDRDGHRGDRSDRDGRRGDRERRPRMCTQEYAPVCARRGGSTRTFGNACEARGADYRVVHPGRC